MEKERFFGNPNAPSWNSSDPQTPPGLNSGRTQPPPPPPPCFLNLNWDQSMDQSAAFESALSSLVSSPTSNQPESIVIHELIGRLGSICNSGEISPPSRFQSADTSCYSTPMNSPPKFNLSVIDGRGGIPASAKLVPFSHDPGFAERAARLSCFGSRSYPQFGLAESGKLSGVSSGNEISMQDRTQLEMGTRPRFCNRLSGSTTPEDREFAREEPSASDHFVAAGETNARKRKAPPKGKGKEASKVIGEENTNAKRSKSSESNGAEKDTTIKPKAEQNGGAIANGDADKKLVISKENNAKPAEPPKDYIHVRARRGQATDSHSLAERVRREKISERMKFLQDLVPGCNKVTGKAVMLDEIINYVQSLQRQVEFLSMKLATVNPRLDFNIENIIQKEMNQNHGHMPPHSIYPFDVTSAAFAYNHQTQGTTLQSAVTNGLETHYSMNPLDSGIRQSLSMQLNPVDGFGDATSQLGTLWEDDLHSVVHMGIDHSQEAAFSSQSFHGLLPAAHMKIEL